MRKLDYKRKFCLTIINKSCLNIISLNQLESTKTLPGAEPREKEFLAKTRVVSDTNFKSDYMKGRCV